MSFLLKIAEFSAEQFDYHQLPKIATEALCTDYDSESLRILAGFDENTEEHEVMFYFRKSLKELGILLPDIKEAILFLSYDIAKRIISKNISEYDGSKLIWNLLRKWPKGTYEEPESLLRFMCLASEIEDTLYNMEDGGDDSTDSIKKVKQEIVEHAKLFVLEKGKLKGQEPD